MFIHLVNDAAANVVARDEPIHSNLFLDAEVPLVDVGRFCIARDDRINTCCGEYDVFGNDDRKRIPSGISLPWIIKAAHRICKLNQTASRRRALYSADGLEVRVVVEDPV